jgi:outer membrane protein assembly factor BamB
MTGIALVVAVALGHAGVATRLPPAPVKLWDIAWQRLLVPPSPLEWKPQERGGPVVDSLSGLILVGTRDGWLHALDTDGKRVWDFKTGGRIEAPPLIDGEAVYFGSSDGGLYALELATGKLLWRYDAQEDVGTTPAVAGGLVLVMTLQDTLVAVEAKTGTWKWHHRRETREGFTILGAAPVQIAGSLVLGAYSDGTVAALELQTGVVRWERRIAASGDFMDVDALRLQGNRLYAAAYSGGVYALDVQTGRQEWEFKAPGACRLALSGGLLLAVTPTQVLGLSSRDGKQRWSIPLEGVPSGSPVVVAGWAAIPNSKGLLLIDATAGRMVGLFDPGTGVSATPASSGHRIYVLSNSADLLALDLSA